MIPQIARFMGPTWGPPGSCRPQMGPMLDPWTLLLGTMSPGRRPAIIRADNGLLMIGPSGINYGIWIKMPQFSFNKIHYGVGSWSLYTKQATPGSPPLLCRGHPTQSATSTMEPQGFQWALTQWRRSPVKVTRSPWDYFLKTQNGWQPTCVDMQNNVENVFVECTIYFLTIMQLTEAGLSIWQVQ